MFHLLQIIFIILQFIQMVSYRDYGINHSCISIINNNWVILDIIIDMILIKSSTHFLDNFDFLLQRNKNLTRADNF